MANSGASTKMDFQDYKKLTSEEREFFVFTQLCKIDDLSDLDKRFAGAWVETAVKAVGGVVLLGFLASIMSLVGWHTSSTPDTITSVTGQ